MIYFILVAYLASPYLPKDLNSNEVGMYEADPTPAQTARVEMDEPLELD